MKYGAQYSGFLGTTKKRECVKYSNTDAIARRGEERETARLDQQAKAWVERDNRRREREERQRKRQALRDAELAMSEDKRYRRTREKLAKEGWAEHEIDELLHGVGYNPMRRRQRMEAACGGLCIRNPSPEDWSQQFHGRPHATKDGKVVIGTLENVRYRAPAGSSRAGVLWDHQVLDRGALRPRATRKPLLVADPNSGRVSISGGDMRFKPSHGLVG